MSSSSLAASPAVATRPARRRRPSAGRVILYLALSVGALFMIAPFVWMIVTSLKTNAETATFDWLPHAFHFGNYSQAMSAAPFARYFLNTVILTVGQTAITLVFATMAGYSLARFAFRGRGVVFGYTLSMMMVPYAIIMVPLFLVVKSMPLFGGNDILGHGGSGWINTWWALIVPPAINPLYTFLARQFYLSLPEDLSEAARLDGASEFGIFLKIMTPLIRPALVTISVFQIEAAWNSFLWPLLVTRDDSLRPIQTGLAIFTQSNIVVQWPWLMAGSVLATAPMILLFVVLQRYYIQGMASSGLKG